MAEIINLRRARKRKSRQEAASRAQDNRALHSIAAKSRELEKARQELNSKNHDGKMLGPVVELYSEKPGTPET